MLIMERDLTSDEFKRFHDYIYNITGIHYPNEKLELLSNRIRTRIRAKSDASYDSYLRRLRSATGAQELQLFLDSITTNETYFFRCQRHWDYFRNWLEQKKTDPKLKQNGLKIWSAAASNGSEACTMMIVLHQVFGDDFGGMPVQVLGTDLSTEILSQAKQATFRQYALSQTPQAVIDKYFQRVEKDHYVFDRSLLGHIRFSPHNLIERLITPQIFDAVFLRNVMIYFDRSSRERVLDHVSHVMRPGGLLIVGESESLLGENHEFEYQKPSIFCKPSKAGIAGV
jgi:chemotaxis protein methyltransferase CheR